MYKISWVSEPAAGVINKSMQGLGSEMVMNFFVSKMCGGGSL